MKLVFKLVRTRPKRRSIDARAQPAGPKLGAGTAHCPKSILKKEFAGFTRALTIQKKGIRPRPHS